jgi:hypothetical protein
MTTKSFVFIRDAFGNMLTVVSAWNKLDYKRKENEVGQLTLTLDPSQVDPAIFDQLRVDYRLEVWRQVGGYAPYLDGETIWFLRKWGYKMNARGEEMYTLECRDANYIWGDPGTIAAYDTGNNKAELGPLPADDALKLLAAENRGSTATDTTRDLTAYMTIAGDQSLCSNIHKQYAWRGILATMQEICADAYKAGEYLVFDTVYTSPTMLEFKTYKNQRGNDHGGASADIVTINRHRMNLEEPELVEDHLDEANYIYATGQGEKGGRILATASLDNAVGQSPFNRREKFVTSDGNTTAKVQAEANAAVMLYRARRRITGRIVDTAGCQDGIHYRWGDIVFVEYRGRGYNAHIDAMHVTLEKGKETRENKFTGSEPA